MTPGNPNSELDQINPVLHLILRPHRSLSMRGFRLVMALVIAVNMAGATFFTLMGAWPMLPFFGLDILVLWWAFRANYRAAAAFETIRIDAINITIERHRPKHPPHALTLPTPWVRFEEEKGDDDHADRLFLCFRGQRFELATDLPPPERPLLARELKTALATAKKGLQFSGG